MGVIIRLGDNTTDTYSGTGDTQIREANPTRGYGDEDQFEATKYTAGDYTSSLIKFTPNLATILGPGKTIVGATLNMRLKDAVGGSRTTNVRRLLRDWVEPASVIPSDGASWNSFRQPSGTPAIGSSSFTTYANRTNTTITAPTGIVDGNLLVLAHFVGSNPTAPTATLPSGFTVIQGPTLATDGAFQGYRVLAVKTASGESGDYTVTHTAGNSQGVMLRITGASAANVTSTNNAGTGSTTTALGVTTVRPNALVLFVVHNWVLYGAASVPTGTTPTFTELIDDATSLFYVAYGTLASPGSTGNKTHANANAAPDPWGAFMLGIDGNDWATAGGTGADTDRVNTPSVAVATTTGQIGSYVQFGGSGIIADVQGWYAGTFSNYGWHLEDNGGVDSEYRVFDSSEALNGLRPYLEIEYEPGPVAWNLRRRQNRPAPFKPGRGR